MVSLSPTLFPLKHQINMHNCELVKKDYLNDGAMADSADGKTEAAAASAMAAATGAMADPAGANMENGAQRDG